MISDTDRKILLNLVDLFDPTITCTQPECTTSTSFKSHWLFRSCDWSVFHSTDMNREQALEWWHKRQTIAWYCSEHEKDDA